MRISSLIPGAVDAPAKERGKASAKDMMFLYYLMTLTAKCAGHGLPQEIDKADPEERHVVAYGKRFAACFGLSPDEAVAAGRMFFAVSREKMTVAYCAERLRLMCARDTLKEVFAEALPAFLDDGDMLYNHACWHAYGEALLGLYDGDEDAASEAIAPHFRALAADTRLSAGARLRRLHPDVYAAKAAHRVFAPGLRSAYDLAYNMYRASRAKNDNNPAGVSFKRIFPRAAKA